MFDLDWPSSYGQENDPPCPSSDETPPSTPEKKRSRARCSALALSADESKAVRVLAQRGLHAGIGWSDGGRKGGERRLAVLMASLAKKDIDIKGLIARINSPIRFIPPHGGNLADGYEATILPDICAVIIEAGRLGKLQLQQDHLAER